MRTKIYSYFKEDISSINNAQEAFPFIFGVFDEEHDFFEIALEFVKFFIFYLGG